MHLLVHSAARSLRVMLVVAACGGDEGKRAPDATGAVEVAYNFCPVFDLYTVAPRRVPLGGVAEVSVNVTDPEGGPLTYAWSATRGAFQHRHAPRTRYLCNTPGIQTLTLTVKDDKDCTSIFQVRVECLDGG